MYHRWHPILRELLYPHKKIPRSITPNQTKCLQEALPSEVVVWVRRISLAFVEIVIRAELAGLGGVYSTFFILGGEITVLTPPRDEVRVFEVRLAIAQRRALNSLNAAAGCREYRMASGYVPFHRCS